MKKSIKKQVLEEGNKKWDIFWETNRDRIDSDGDKFIELDKSVISKVSFVVGFEKAIDLTTQKICEMIEKVLEKKRKDVNNWNNYKWEKELLTKIRGDGE